jgi:gas vesicle protein
MNEYEQQLGGSGNGDPEARGRSPQEIEREIEATRERMGRDIDELGERLSPSNLKRQAKDAITGKAQDIANNMGESARHTGSRMMDFVYENTSLVAAMGLGAVWLIRQRNKSEISGDRMARFAYTGPERRREGIVGKIADRAEQVGQTVRESVSSAASAVGERASDLGHTAKYRGRQARGGIERLVEENPLAVAAGVVVLGLAAGLAVPESEREQRLMGPTRDDLVDRAQKTARRVKDAAVEAGQELKETVRDEVNERAPEVKAVVQDAVQSVGQQVKEKAGQVKEEAKQAVKENRPGRGTAPA